MKKILIIFVLALSAQVSFAQLYSIAEHERYNKRTFGWSTSLPSGNIIAIQGIGQQAPLSVSMVTPAQSTYSVHAWKGQTYAVGSTVNTTAPVIRRSGFGNDNKPADPAVPLGNTPWLWLLLCALMYGVSRRLRREVRKKSVPKVLSI